MPYIVTQFEPHTGEGSLMRLLTCDGESVPSHAERRYPYTVTRFVAHDASTLYPPNIVSRLIERLENIPTVSNLNAQYDTYYIKKRSGGVRTISSPSVSLRDVHDQLKKIFEEEFRTLYHTSAFAYIGGRNIRNCIERHQVAGSRWFLRIDFSDFFGSTSESFMFAQLEKIVPFSLVMQDERGARLLKEKLSICFLKGGLPQGTTISPMLTNLVMIPIDHEISGTLHRLGFTYTRYADDLLISHKYPFSAAQVVSIIEAVLNHHRAPYKINNNKTRYGSICGSNWNLGLMLNKDCRITIGHQEHKRMKARLYSFVVDTKNGKPWSESEAQKLMGQLAYYKQIEPSNATHMIYNLNKKLKVNCEEMLKRTLRKKKRFRRKKKQ